MINKVVVTCEHGGNEIPGEYEKLFHNYRELLKSHRGFDPGALDLAKKINENAGDYFFYSTTSRLLVELNRSLHHPNLFSVVTFPLAKETKNKILLQYYDPYRNEVENKICELIEAGNKILHLSVHTFTPVLDEQERKADIGLLFDSARKKEKAFCKQWKLKMTDFCKDFKIRFNYPYLGSADGFTTALRKKFISENYIGIELEVNQKFIFKEKRNYGKLESCISDSLKAALNP